MLNDGLVSVTIGAPEAGVEAPAPVAPAVPAAKPDAVLAPGNLNPVNPAPVKDERPAWLPAKFKDAEQMAKAYAGLEEMLGKGQKLPAEEPVKPATEVKTEGDKPAVDPDVKPAPEQPVVKPDVEVEKELTAKSLDFNKYVNEYAGANKLSTESYAELQKAGYDKPTVDAWIDGRIAVAERNSTELFAIAGGKDTFAEVSKWAGANLPKAEVDAYNRAVNSGDQNLAKLAVTGLNAKFVEANGSEPKLLGGKGGNNSQDVYRSRAELTADIKNPKYGKDSAFRADVEAKAIRSNL